MYHPYFRGKQYELITIREMALLIQRAEFRPIIEPVKETLSGLHRALDALVAVNGRAILIVNPHHGDLSEDGELITALLRDKFLDKPGISAGILLKNGMTIESVYASFQQHA